jgi:uncharacterized protein
MAEDTPALRNYSWDDVIRFSAQLAAMVGALRIQPTVVVAVLRGGAFPALLLSHKLGIRRMYALRVSTTLTDVPHAARMQPTVEGIEGLPDLSAEHVLVVDDVTNTGATLTNTVRRIQEACSPGSVITGTLVWDTVPPSGSIALRKCAANLWVESVHAWAAFPWEYATDRREGSRA